MKEILRLPGVFPLVLSGFSGNVAAWIYAVAMTTFLYQSYGTFAVAMYGLGRQLVYLVLSPLAGTLIDKFPRRQLLVVINLLSAVAMFALVLLTHLEITSWVALCLIILIQVFVGTVDYPLRMVLGPKLVNSDQLLSLNSLSNATGTVALMAAPGIAGIILYVKGTEFEFLMTGIIYIISMLTVMKMPRFLNGRDEQTTDSTQPARNPLAQTVQNWIEGFAFIFKHGKILMANILLFVNHIVVGALFVFIPYLADLIGQGEIAIGYLMTANGVGSVLGSLVGGRLAKKRPGLTIAAATLGLGLSCIICGLFPSLYVVYAMVMLMGFFAMGSEVPILTIIQQATPDEKSGRVWAAVDTLFIGGMALGSLLVGALHHNVGFGLMLGVIGAFPAITSLFTGRSFSDKAKEPTLTVTP